MAANTNGLIYYKLDATSNGYLGDVTKNCGLRGEEIDGNFNFLRGHDIKSIAFDKDGTIQLVRYNGELLTAKSVDTPNYDFKYDSNNGTLTIITPSGEEIILDGFNVNTTVYHDNTLVGDGTIKKPLQISNMSKTGRLLPAIKLVDVTTGEKLPTQNISKHDRYLTKEFVNVFGLLYPLEGVQEISNRLKSINSEWRIPTKKDWDDMLNSIDCSTPNHNSPDSNLLLGEYAGAALKSNKYWLPFNNRIMSDDTYNFAILPVGYVGNRGTKYYGNTIDSGAKYYGSFGESAAFWTSTEEDPTQDMYVKLFEYNEERVGQRTWGENYHLSLRLVKTFTGDNFNNTEDIDGFTVNCVHVNNTNLIWTQTNIAFSQEQYQGFEPPVWEDYKLDEDKQKVKYFVNDWNGKEWNKQELKEGESIVLHNGLNGDMHEWVLVNGELTDTTIIVKGEFEEEFNKLQQNDAVLANELISETNERVEADNRLLEYINNENLERITNDETLQRQINENKVINADNSLIVIPGRTSEENTTSTTLKINIDTNSTNIKLDDNGIYFDGYFGTF